MKIVEDHYQAFQGMAFSDREKWHWYARPLWWYLIAFVWLHQGIVHKNWENFFEGFWDPVKNKYKKYQQRRNMKRILSENPDIDDLRKLSGIKRPD